MTEGTELRKCKACGGTGGSLKHPRCYACGGSGDIRDVYERPFSSPLVKERAPSRNIDHTEAWDLAHHRQENSNLARCYIDLRMAVKGLLEGDSMARLEKIDASIADSTVKIGDSQ